jgi:hypothetical protein
LATYGFLGPVFGTGVGAHDLQPSAVATEAQEVLGNGVVGGPQSAWPLTDLATVARWEPGEWWYRITAGPRRGETERESLVLNSTTSGRAWTRTVGEEYTLHLRQSAERNLLLPTQIAHAHKALVHFDPPLSYLLVDLRPGERRVFEGKIEVYSLRNPAKRWYSGRILATTVYGGVYRITTPAGTFTAALIKTDYQIDILSVVSVTDTLHTFYARGVGKVAEAESRRVAMGLIKADTKAGKILLSFAPQSPSSDQQSP